MATHTAQISGVLQFKAIEVSCGWREAGGMTASFFGSEIRNSFLKRLFRCLRSGSATKKHPVCSAIGLLPSVSTEILHLIICHSLHVTLISSAV